MKYLKTIIVTSLALVAMLFTSSVMANNKWGELHWARNSSPFTLKVIDSTTSDWNNELNDSLDAWSVSPVIDLVIASANAGKGARRRCAVELGQMRVCNYSYGNNGWLGLATVYSYNSNPNDIVAATAQMNDFYFMTSEDKNHVMCQETGHGFGLGHTSEDGSSQKTCMDYSSDPLSQWPNDHDYQMLAEIYADLDDYNSYDDSPVASTVDVCNAPPGKGCNKNAAKSNNKVIGLGHRIVATEKYEIWVQAGDNGLLMIHHVYLATENHH